MTARHLVGLSQAEALELAAALNKLDGYPAPGVHVGGGHHVPQPSTWDGTGAVPPGWSAHAAKPKPRTPGQYRVSVPQETLDRRAEPGRRGRLSARERSLVDALAPIDALPADWRE